MTIPKISKQFHSIHSKNNLPFLSNKIKMKLKEISEKVEHCLETTFSKWGLIVGKYHWQILLICVLFCAACLYGFIAIKDFEDEGISWTPRNCDFVEDKKEVDEYYGDLGRIVTIYAESNDNDNEPCLMGLSHLNFV